MYFAQTNGVAYYTMTGGTISATSGTEVTLASGVSTQGFFTINGPTALASLPSLSLDTAAAGIGNVTLENGTLAVDNISTMTSAPAGYSGFFFSGGTLQPLDGSAVWGTSSYALTFYLSGTGTTISSNDLISGIGQTVQVNANLSGTGAITFTGSGVTTLLGGTFVNGGSYTALHTGATFVTGGGTLQLADPGWPPADQNPPGGLGSGPLTISGATVDLDGMNSTVGALERRFFRLDHQLRLLQRRHVDRQPVIGRGHHLCRHDRRRPHEHDRADADGQRHAVSHRHEYV